MKAISYLIKGFFYLRDRLMEPGTMRSLMIVAEYRNRRVRVFSVPDSAAVQFGLHCMSEPLIIPEPDHAGSDDD